MSCILIGNGTSVLDGCAVRKIDSFDFVVRFNNCQIKGYENHVGSRTTDWWTVLKFQRSIFDQLSPLTSIWFHSWVKDESQCEAFKTYLNTPARKVDLAMTEEMCAYSGQTQYSSWSTGAIAIWFSLKTFPFVSLCGFDWWMRRDHHYCDNANRGTLHKPEIEKIFIDRMREEGKVEFL